MITDNAIGVKNPIELDLFMLETNARKMITDLINPILSKMNDDHEKMVAANQRNARIEERLLQVEHVLGLQQAKPKIFEEIKDELANIRATMKLQEQVLMEKVDIMDLKMRHMKDVVDDCSHVTNFLSGKAE